MVRNEMQNLQTRLAQFKDQTKAKNVKNNIKKYFKIKKPSSGIR